MELATVYIDIYRYIKKSIKLNSIKLSALLIVVQKEQNFIKGNIILLQFQDRGMKIKTLKISEEDRHNPLAKVKYHHQILSIHVCLH